LIAFHGLKSQGSGLTFPSRFVKAISFPRPRIGFPAASVAAAWLAFAPVATSQALRVDEIVPEGGTVSLRVRSDPGHYYLLDRFDLAQGNAGPAIDIATGVEGSGNVRDANPPGVRGFYRVRGIPIETPGDEDGDLMDDVFELDSGLNALDPADAAQSVVLDGQSTSRVDAYLNNYEIGRGMHDVTGVAFGGSMMGYADGEQKTTGIHDRQWARAFIVRDRMPPYRRVVHVAVENGQIFESISQAVHDKIRADPELSPYYSYENIVLNATHTHGGGGGHSHFALYHASIGGYSWRTFDALVHGCYMAIKKAHRDLKPGSIKRNRGHLLDANENRAAMAFLQNVELTSPGKLANPFDLGEVQPPDNSYFVNNRDTEMFTLRFEHQGIGPVGMCNWFAVHGVSVSKENTLLTGDNKGYAAQLFEKERGTIYPGFPGYNSEVSTFVAAFATSNPGDMTSNRRTLETPWPAHGVEDYERARRIGERQLQKARKLFNGEEGSLAKVSGPVDYRHAYVDFNSIAVDPAKIYPYNLPDVGFPGSTDSPPWQTGVGALGVEFARGTLDGEALPQVVVSLLISLGGEPILDSAQYPKDILLTTASTDKGGLTPHWLPISILRIGDVAILSVPAEFTVMAGWRLRKTVERAFAEEGQRVRAILSGLSNSYSGYVTTYEEYLYEELILGVPNQIYEAASTHFGAFTLAAYQTKFAELARSMATGNKLPAPPEFVQVPAYARPDHPIVNPLDMIPFLDSGPPPRTSAATFHETAGCPVGQFHDIFTGDCWSCPAGYERTVIPIVPITAADACVRPAFSTFSFATQHAAAGCPIGQFYDLSTGDCWSCPSGYNRTIFAITGSSACEKPAYSVFTSAQSTTATGGSDCPSGYVYDFILGFCYKCPTGYNKNIFNSWNSSNACERSELQTTGANVTSGSGIFGTDCPSGYVFDFGLGMCYRCPSGYNKTILQPWNSGSACERTVLLTSSASSVSATGGTTCPSGYVYDFILARCYRCPSGYNKYVFQPWNSAQACEAVIPAAFSSATRHGDGGCPVGQFLDIGFGTCWSCPSGYVRTVSAVNTATACEKVNPAVYAPATKHGKFACEARNPSWFLDIGLNQCWSCPAGYVRTLDPVTAGTACSRPRVFGETHEEPSASYAKGGTVRATFWAGHPGNTFGLFVDDLTNAIETFFEIQRFQDNQWRTVRTDANWDTTFTWEPFQGSGLSTVLWKIPADADSGTYRILYHGYNGDFAGVTRYIGASASFQIQN
jgi:neutral ceramidase